MKEKNLQTYKIFKIREEYIQERKKKNIWKMEQLYEHDSKLGERLSCGVYKNKKKQVLKSQKELEQHMTIRNPTDSKYY